MPDILFRKSQLLESAKIVEITDNKIQFSIIIPVYNKANFIATCLDSILAQTYNNYEIICVNDGSTDNSLEILEYYARKDSRIKVYSQENQGVSAARNFGIINAQGEYLLFCDADDKFKPELCETVALQIKKEPADVIAFGHENYVDNRFESICIKDIQELKKQKTLENQLNLQIYVWEKAFRKEFILEKDINFPVGIKNAEDIIFCLQTLFKGATYSLLEEALYCYTKEINGESTFTNPNGIKNDTEAYKFLTETEFFKNLTISEQRITVNLFIGGSVVYFKTLKKSKYKDKIVVDLQNLYSIILSKYSLTQCIKMKNFREIHKILFKEKHKKFFKYFNIITTKDKKTFVALGINFTFKRKRIKEF